MSRLRICCGLPKPSASSVRKLLMLCMVALVFCTSSLSSVVLMLLKESKDKVRSCACV